jgi:hypothetical protein
MSYSSIPPQQRIEVPILPKRAVKPSKAGKPLKKGKKKVKKERE